MPTPFKLTALSAGGGDGSVSFFLLQDNQSHLVSREGGDVPCTMPTCFGESHIPLRRLAPETIRSLRLTRISCGIGRDA